MKKFIQSAAMFLLIVGTPVAILTSCGGDDDTEKVTLDTAELDQLITECSSLANSATTNDYPQSAIDAFKTTIAAVKDAEAKATSQTIISNLVTQIQEAKKTFEESAFDAIPSSALLLEYTFDEEKSSLTSTGSQALVATSHSGPAEVFGTEAQAPKFVDGVKGKAVKLTKGAYYSIDNYNASSFLTPQLSISVWVNPTETRAGNYILSFNYWNNWKLNLQTENKPFFTIATKDGIADADNENVESAPKGKWTHLVVSLNLTKHTLDFYVDGQLTKSWDASGKGPLAASTQAAEFKSTTGDKLPILIGCASTLKEVSSWSWTTLPITPAAWDSFEGSLDELKVYNTALTAGQVSKLYNAEKK